MLESDLNIHDELVQKKLSQASDDKMKNIVATIQRDQNAIIRNESSSTLIIQGVAGSGKTSVALHRIAFLLYRYKNTITSKDILIISPNKVFADYIANVLPELGEEKIPEKGVEELASEVLDHKFRFQNFFQQVGELLEKNDEEFIRRIQFKASFEFLNDLNQYLLHIENNYFQAEDMIVKKISCSVELTKSYRSTCEIISFARQISGADNMEVIERHGDNPEVKGLKNKDDEIREIKSIVSRFINSGQNSLGIICKTQKQADWLHSRLKEDYRDIYLLNTGSSSFSNGVIITSAHLAKGLEFDQVLVPFATAGNYTTEVDRGLLYIACTRAMHRLTLTYSKECTGFIKKSV